MAPMSEKLPMRPFEKSCLPRENLVCSFCQLKLFRSHKKIGASGIWSRELPIRRLGVTTALPDALIAASVSLAKWPNRLHVISMYGTFDKTNHVTPNLHRMISDLHPLFIGRANRKRIILGGDWNIDPKYNDNYPHSAPFHRLVFERLEGPFYGLQKCNKEPLRTIIRRNKFSYQDDYIYANKWLVDRLISCDVVKTHEAASLSDHLPVLVVFKL